MGPMLRHVPHYVPDTDKAAFIGEQVQLVT